MPADDRRALVLFAATIARCAVFLDITTSTAAWGVTVDTLALAANPHQPDDRTSAR